MPEDEKPKEEEKTKMSEDESKDDKKEDKEKSSTVLDTLTKIESAVAKFDTSKLEKSIAEIGDRVKALETLKTVAEKAMEEPTDLPLKPQVQASEDIGAKVKVPDTYQSNSQQAGITDSDPQNERKQDQGGLKMQEKAEPAVEPPTPVAKSIEVEKVAADYRPPTFETASEILKSRGEEFNSNPVLKACRETPYEELGQIVGRGIMKGRYGNPADGEVARW